MNWKQGLFLFLLGTAVTLLFAGLTAIDRSMPFLTILGYILIAYGVVVLVILVVLGAAIIFERLG